MKRIRPSGSQQRKLKKKKEEETKEISGSILKYVNIPHTSSSATTGVTGDVYEEQRPQIESGEAGTSEASRKTYDIQSSESEYSSDTDGIKESPSVLEGAEIEEPRGKSLRKSPTHKQKKSEDGDKEGGESLALSYSDVASWTIPLPHDLRVSIIKRGSEPFQNKDGPFSSVKRQGEKLKGETRQLTTAWFYKVLINGEKVLRTWMVYSPLKESLFCFCCRLFAHDDKKMGTSSFITGFKTWWKLNPKVSDHESSKEHLTCLEKWKTLAAGLKLGKTIDHSNQIAMDKERKKWRDILHRLLDVTLFLARQNLPFRGHREDMLSANKGNFLELLELLSNYDPVLKEHLLEVKHVIPPHSGRRLSSYLSPSIQNEFISLLGCQVKEEILADIRNAKYYGILFDSTPDISHNDQMSEVIRYVHTEGDTVQVRESFLGFIPIAGKTADALTKDILCNLEKDGLDIQLCRSQGYDNAATMSGIHGGVQKKIKEINSKALFVPCANHSLNLCGVHSFGKNPACVTFFGTVERLYCFFALSTHRWEVLKENMDLTVKKLSQTRWSAHHAAVKPLKKQFGKLITALETLTDHRENVDTRGSAECLLKAVCDFSFLGFLSFWCDILAEVDLTQKYLQTEGISLEKCSGVINGLKLFLRDHRNEIVEKAIGYASQQCEEMGISMERRGRIKRKKRMPGELAKDAGLTVEEEMRRSMLECVDQFSQELDVRSEAMDNVMSTFAAIQPHNLLSANEQQLQESISDMSKIFDEISEEEVRVEIMRLRRHLKAAKIATEEVHTWTVLQFLNFIVKWDFGESLPNLSLCLRLFLTICVSVASCERSFSKLKLIKNYLRSTMSQARLNSLAIISIEYERAKNVTFDNVIDKFADAKSRRKRM